MNGEIGSSSADVARVLAAHHLENLKVYGAKARECREAGREDLAAVFRTFALHSGRQWLALVCPSANADRFGRDLRSSAARSVMEAHAAGLRVVTNLQFSPVNQENP